MASRISDLSPLFSMVFLFQVCYNVICAYFAHIAYSVPIREVLSLQIELTNKQYRRLLDLVYIGNWVLNATRGDDRIQEYDEVETLVFSHCIPQNMPKLVELYNGEIIPSRAFAEGGIHEAIMAYEDDMFFEILAQEMALRDMPGQPVTEMDMAELENRMEDYLSEFATNGTDNLSISLG